MRALEILDQHALGDFDLEALRIEAGLEQDRKDHGRNVAAPEIDRRQIDRDRQRVRPRRRFPAGFAQHPFVDRSDRAGFFRQRNEQRGRHHAPHRVSPAQQRLEAENLAAGRGLRLKIQFQLVLLQRRERCRAAALAFRGSGGPSPARRSESLPRCFGSWRDKARPRRWRPGCPRRRRPEDRRSPRS